MYEMSYVDLLRKLRHDVETDLIPEKGKTSILGLISQLELLLWKYSC